MPLSLAWFWTDMNYQFHPGVVVRGRLPWINIALMKYAVHNSSFLSTSETSAVILAHYFEFIHQLRQVFTLLGKGKKDRNKIGWCFCLRIFFCETTVKPLLWQIARGLIVSLVFFGSFSYIGERPTIQSCYYKSVQSTWWMDKIMHRILRTHGKDKNSTAKFFQ